MACQDAKGRGNYPSEPSIKDVETWLDWQAFQMDMPYWWLELTAIPGVGDPRKLAWKIHASFSIPAVKSKVFLHQGYTVPPAPRCLTWSVFLSDELSYQDMWQQPFLLTLAYAQGLQYWAERLNPPADLDFCPLARSVLDLKERVKEHVIFSKQDVIQGLGRIDPGTTSWWPQPTITGIGSMESNSAGVWETHGTTSSFGSLPERGDTTVPSTKLQIEDWPIGQDASPVEVTTQTGGQTDQSHHPTWLDRRGKVVHISCDCFGKELEFGNDQCRPWGHSDCLSWRWGLWESLYGSCSPGPFRERGVISNQGATMKELGKNDAVRTP